MIYDKLPDKPSAILRAALKDLAKIENNPISFDVEMTDWIKLNVKSGKCEVCLAGASLVHTCEMGVREFDWKEIPVDLSNKMEFLNECVHGSVHEALVQLMARDDIPEGVPRTFGVAEYNKIDRHQFRHCLNNLADLLEKAGI
jgi:hypothetical protein